MAYRSTNSSHRDRELRRRVILPARIRYGSEWTDTCILNISSRGLLIHSARPVAEGTTVEIRRDSHVIVARVMWRDGARMGLRAEDRVPVADIMSLGQSHALKLTAETNYPPERRRQKRVTPDDARARGRAFDFLSIVVVGACLALTASSLARQALTRPFAVIEAALVPNGPQPEAVSR